MKNFKLAVSALFSFAIVFVMTASARATTCYPDADADGFGDASSPGIVMPSCGPGFTDNNGDCDDADPSVHPGAVELCNGVDDDCNGLVDDNAANPSLWFADLDLDTHGDPNNTVIACYPPPNYVTVGDDCDDANSAIWPFATEVCNGTDDNCDGLVDNNAVDAPAWHPDGDLDGFGSTGGAIVTCNPPPGYALDGSDCDDADPSVHPGAVELCNGVDDNCNGLVDDNAANPSLWFADLDLDTHGDPNNTVIACYPPPNYVTVGDDCDDANSAIWPFATEVCNGTDDNCNQVIDEGCVGCLVVLTGDVNVSGTLTSADIIAMVNFVFKGGAMPQPCQAAGDVNCNGAVTSADIIAMVNHVFKGGPPPCNVCQLIPGLWSCP